MKTLIRWGKFNLVGVMGMAVQLGSLAVLYRWLGEQYLLATALALEVTLLHNFCWHVRYTWQDCTDGGSLVKRLVRFHLSSGLVSLAGNLGLVRVLHGSGVPLLAANAVAILACSLVNFWVGNIWAFGAGNGGIPEISAKSLPAKSQGANSETLRCGQIDRGRKYGGVWMTPPLG